jgi:predicted phage terminase large subunit-like protein
MCCFLIESDLYIYKVLRDFLTGPDLIDKVKEFLNSCNYHVTKSTLSIELKASGHTVFQFLKKDGINVKASPDPKDDKQTRLLAISGSLSSGRVKLVEGAWNGSFLDEVCIPPEVRKYWDQTDLLSSSVEELIGGDKPRKVTKSRLH